MKDRLIENKAQAFFIASVTDVLLDEQVIARESFEFLANHQPVEVCLDPTKSIVYGDQLAAGVGSAQKAVQVFEAICQSPIAETGTIVYQDKKPQNHWERRTEEARKRHCGDTQGNSGSICRGPGRYS